MRLIRAASRAPLVTRLACRQNMCALISRKSTYARLKDFGVILGGSLATPLLRRCRVVPILSVSLEIPAPPSLLGESSTLGQHAVWLKRHSQKPKSADERPPCTSRGASTFHAAAMCASCQYSISLNAPCLFYFSPPPPPPPYTASQPASTCVLYFQSSGYMREREAFAGPTQRRLTLALTCHSPSSYCVVTAAAGFTFTSAAYAVLYTSSRIEAFNPFDRAGNFLLVVTWSALSQSDEVRAITFQY